MSKYSIFLSVTLREGIIFSSADSVCSADSADSDSADSDSAGSDSAGSGSCYDFPLFFSMPYFGGIFCADKYFLPQTEYSLKQARIFSSAYICYQFQPLSQIRL